MARAEYGKPGISACPDRLTDYFLQRHDPAVEAKRLQKRIEALGFDITTAAAAA